MAESNSKMQSVRTMGVSLAVVLAANAVVTAAPFIFDANPTVGAPGAQDGGGTWDKTTFNWIDGAAPASNIVWPNNSLATFGAGTNAPVGSPYNITVAESLNATGFTFLNSGYVLKADAPVTISPSTATHSPLSVAADAVATFGSNVTFANGAGIGSITVKGGGTLNLAGGNLTGGANFVPIDIGGSTATDASTVLDVKTGSTVLTTSGNSSGVRIGGTLRISGGNVEVRNTEPSTAVSHVTVGLLAAGAGNDLRTGTLEMTSGTIAIYRNNANTANSASGSLRLGARGTTGGTITSVANLSGGVVTIPNTPAPANGGSATSTNGGIIMASGTTGTNNTMVSTLNLSGTIDASVGPKSTLGLRFFNASGQTNTTATVNLNGGTLTVPVISSAGAGAGTTGTLNFNGGTLRGNADNASFLASGLSGVTARVQNGGAVVDTDAFILGIGLPLQHDTGSNPIDGGLKKLGTGTLTLSGTNTYTGPTLVSAGTLALTAANAVATSNVIDIASNATLDVSGVAGGFTVASGQVIKGQGTVTGNTTIAAGATLAPGSSPGTINVGGLTVNGTLQAEVLGAAAGTAYDQANVTGAVTLGSNSLLDLQLGYAPAENDVYTLILNDGTDAITGTFAGISQGGSVFATFAGTSYEFTASYVGGTGNDFTLTSAVPEPASIALLGLGGLALLRRRRA